MFKKKCYNGGNQHKFEARYDEMRSFKAERVAAQQMKNLLVHKVYIKDVCVWCGKTIERGE